MKVWKRYLSQRFELVQCGGVSILGSFTGFKLNAICYLYLNQGSSRKLSIGGALSSDNDVIPNDTEICNSNDIKDCVCC